MDVKARRPPTDRYQLSTDERQSAGLLFRRLEDLADHYLSS